jgi:hypothetical protein
MQCGSVLAVQYMRSFWRRRRQLLALVTDVLYATGPSQTRRNTKTSNKRYFAPLIQNRNCRSATLLKFTASQIKRIVDMVDDGDVGFKDQEIAAAKKKLDFCKSKQHIWDDLQRLRNIELPEIRDEIGRKRREHVRAH